MADEHVSTRDVVYLEPISDPLLAFFWARLDGDEADARRLAAVTPGGKPGERYLADLAAKRAILDDYARYCADVDNPARQVICQVTRDVIKHLATVYAEHPDYREDFRP